MTAPLGRPSEAALWRSVETTLRDVVLPCVDDAFARNSVIQLVGLARYAIERGADPTDERLAAIAGALHGLAGNSLVPAVADGADRHALLATASTALTAAQGRDDAEAVAVRAALRRLLIDHLVADLAGNGVLISAFRGVLPDA